MKCFCSQRPNRALRVFAVAVAVVLLVGPTCPAGPDPRHTPDVIYGRKNGMALTMEVFRPVKPNGMAVIAVISGGWMSAPEMIPIFRPLFTAHLDRGYTVFAVGHGSQPLFTIPDAVDDIHRSVRFIKSHAKEYGIDPNRIGVTGASAGGHLALMLATDPRPGDPEAFDRVERESSRVAAVGCFFPPTDFLNYGKPGEFNLGENKLREFAAAFDFRTLDAKTRTYIRITDEAKRQQIARSISPLYQVRKESARL